MSSPNTALYDVVILPEPAIAKRAMHVSQQLSEQGTHFTLDGTQFFPHASLYMLQMRKASVARAVQHLAVVAANNPALELAAEKYGGSRGYINASYATPPELTQLQEQVIDCINPLRDGLSEEETANLATATGPAKDNIQRYGYKSIGELYVPHLTLSRFVEPTTTPEPGSLPPLSDFTGQFSEIGLFEVGDHGTCIREIARFALLGNDFK